MTGSSKKVFHSGFLLALIALLGTALLTGVNALTHERIVEQESLRMMQQLHAIVPAGSFNNNPLQDRIEISDETHLRDPDPVTVYRTRMDGKPVAALMIVTAPDGYNGDIRMLVGINNEGLLLGVRIVAHKETPGLGDPISLDRSDWILGFSNRSLQNPDRTAWAVKKDGGVFDQFTGATISPRAVVKTVRDSLLFFEANKVTLFDRNSEPVTTSQAK